MSGRSDARAAAPQEEPDVTIAEMSKNSREAVRVMVHEFKGHRFVDIRQFFRTNDGSELKPTAKGVTLRPDMLPDLIAALKEAQQRLDRGGHLSAATSSIPSGTVTP